MAIFDFVRRLPLYAGKPRDADRLNNRHRFLVAPFEKELRDARVLDLASHDGRWPYALARAGAAHVTGIEGRADLISDFQEYPDDDAKARVELIEGDINEELPRLAASGARFDVVTVLGIFYHVTTHYTLLTAIRALRPQLIVIDGEFMNTREPIIQLVREDPGKHMNSLPYFSGQEMVVKGVPSRAGLEMMADTLGYSVEWLDWNELAPRLRTGVRDYYRTGPKTRATCALRPYSEEITT